MKSRRSGELDEAIGQRVKVWRLKRKMSQTRLGELVGVTFQQIQKYENGSNRIGSGRLQLIAQIFDVPVSILFGDEGRLKGDLNEDDALASRLLVAFNTIQNIEAKHFIVDFLEKFAE